MIPPARILAALVAVAAVASGVGAASARGALSPAGTDNLAACSLTCSASATAFADAGRAVDFFANSTLSGCAGSAVYDWDFGDGSPHASVRNPSHTYAAGGTFTWTVVVTADGQTCTRTDTISVCSLDCSATVPPASRAGASIDFVGGAMAAGCLAFNQYLWAFGDGATSAALSPQHAYAAPGTYDWSFTVTRFTATCNRTGSIVIGDRVECADCGAEVPAATEVGTAALFRALLVPLDCAAVVTYAWTFGDGTTSAAAAPSHTYCAVGSFGWTLTVTIDGVACVRSGTINVTAPTALDCSVTVGGGGACPYTAAFTAQASGCNDTATFAWTFGDGGASTVRTPSHQYTATGAFDWTMTASLAGATCSRSGTVTVAAPTSITAVGLATPQWGPPPLGVAFTGDLAFPDCVTDATYSWGFGDGGTSAAQSPAHTFTNEGFYTWALTVQAGDLSDTAKGPVVVTSQAPTYTWAPQLSGTLDPIVDVDFTVENDGWTAAQVGLRHTVDSGRTWVRPLATLNYGVSFLNLLTGFCLAECRVGRTIDGGQSWSTLVFNDCSAFRFTDITTTTPDTAWGTASNGRVWFFRNLGPGAWQSGWSTTGVSHLRSISFSDPDNGWAVGNSGMIVRIASAADLTASYSQQTSGSTANLNGIRMLDGSNGWIVGDGGTILQTADGGATWSPVASGTTIDLFGVDFRNGQAGWIVGGSGLVLATVDGGATWAPEVNAHPEDLRAVSAPSGPSVYAVGLAGLLLKRVPFGCPDIGVAPDVLASARVGSPYAETLAPFGGSPPYSVGIAGGTLPTGMELGSDGALSGTPSGPGMFDFTTRAVDAEFCSGDRSYALGVLPECSVTCSADVPATGAERTPVVFAAGVATTGCIGGAIVAWTFGDGTGSSDVSPAHTYARPGSYAWTLTVTAEDKSCTSNGTIEIRPRVRRVIHAPRGQ
jgi:PKD repeat protein